jgi:hypothetical protein
MPKRHRIAYALRDGLILLTVLACCGFIAAGYLIRQTWRAVREQDEPS